jgi:hypothetical protein
VLRPIGPNEMTVKRTRTDIQEELNDVAFELAERSDHSLTELHELARAALFSIKVRRYAELERKALRQRRPEVTDEDE